MQSKKPSERKAVKKAYEEAINHRCKVTGKDSDCSYSTLKNQTSRLVHTCLLMIV